MMRKPMPIPQMTGKNLRNYWRKVDSTPGQGPKGSCWMWKAQRTDRGYGRFYAGEKMFYAHRVAFTLAGGLIPPGFHVLHHCDNPGCVNPDHLRAGTHADNMRDCLQKGRAGQVRGEQHGRAKLTENQVREIRAKYVPWKYTFEMLAGEYGVSLGVIGGIVHHRIWKHIQ